MHARIEELLAYRDGEPVEAGVKRHIERCAACAAETRRLAGVKDGLRNLPGYGAPAGSFEAIRRRVAMPVRRPSRYTPALATGGAMLACLAAFVWMLHRHEAVTAAGLPAGSTVAADTAIAPLVAHSQRLEALLRALPPRPAAERAATSVTIDRLQSRIQWLDLELAAAGDREQVRNLWSTRVQLLNSLVYVRYAESAGRSGAPLELGVI